MAEAAERWCKKYGWGAKEVTDELKLQYYFGGQSIYLLRSPEGTIVVPIPECYRGTPDLRYVLLTAEGQPKPVADEPTKHAAEAAAGMAMAGAELGAQGVIENLLRGGGPKAS